MHQNHVPAALPLAPVLVPDMGTAPPTFLGENLSTDRMDGLVLTHSARSGMVRTGVRIRPACLQVPAASLLDATGAAGAADVIGGLAFDPKRTKEKQISVGPWAFLCDARSQVGRCREGS